MIKNMIPLGALLSFVMPARADDAALLQKLDAIEKRVAHIETMEQTRGPKQPFAVTLPGKNPGGELKTCQMLGYAASWANTAPGIPDATLLVCYGP